jgi:hypothetical protein
MTDLTDFKNYVDQLNKTTVYQKWANSSSGDANRWKLYAEAIFAGQTPTPPTMSTGFGKSLVLVGIIALKVSGSVADTYGAGYFGDAEFDD